MLLYIQMDHKPKHKSQNNETLRNIEEKCNIEFGNDFMDKTSKTQVTKEENE